MCNGGGGAPPLMAAACAQLLRATAEGCEACPRPVILRRRQSSCLETLGPATVSGLSLCVKASFLLSQGEQVAPKSTPLGPVLGQGSFGCVHRAMRGGEAVAVKVFEWGVCHQCVV